MIDNKTVKKMKEADKLKRNATTKDQMVSALNKINYIRKKNKSNAMKEDIIRRADAKIVKIHTPDGKVVYRKQKPEVKVESAAADINEDTTHETESGTARITSTHVHFDNSGYKQKFSHKDIHKMNKGGSVRGFRLEKDNPYHSKSNHVYSNDDEEHHLPTKHLPSLHKESVLKRDPKQKNLLVPFKGAKGTSKYSRMKAITKTKEKKESQIDEARPSKDDEEGAEHIIMQLRKSVSLRGNKDVMFQDGSSKKVSMKDAQRALDKYNRMKPMDRIKLQKQYEKDFRSFSQAIK